jgi:hypothetical protein
MSETSQSRNHTRRPRIAQRDTTSIEVALLSIVFFTAIFGIIELSRLLYVYNTLQEVTRRAAALAVNVYPNDTAAINSSKQSAIFRNSPGELILASPVTDQHVRLDYLRFDLSVMPTSTWPANAVTNRLICAGPPHAANCIRFVQAQICEPGTGDDCQAVNSQMLIPLLDWTVKLSKSTTIAAVETLGYVPGTAPPPCPCP